jgi:L-ascorbate metabolism protein UlaG (beta-lactamase superfamily)
VILTLVRHATLVLDYAGRRLLVDPMLGDEGSAPAIEDSPNQRPNPLVPLPFPADELVADVDAVLVTHLHADHWDEVARRKLPRNLTVFAQNEADAQAIRADGFTDVRPLSAQGDTLFDGIRIAQTRGQHGSDTVMAAIGARMGEVSGLVLRHPDEPTLYIAGDTVWNAHVADALAAYDPDVVVLNCGDAQVPGLGPIIMDLDDVAHVVRAAPRATIVASHLEAVNHCMLSRAALRAWVDTQDLVARVRVPDDGEACVFHQSVTG